MSAASTSSHCGALLAYLPGCSARQLNSGDGSKPRQQSSGIINLKLVASLSVVANVSLGIALLQPPATRPWQLRASGAADSLQGPPRFPDRSRCKLEKSPTQKTFTYSTPDPAWRTSPKYQEVRDQLIHLRTERFLPGRLKSGLTFAAFKAQLLNFRDKYDGNVETEGYDSAQGQKANTVRWFWGHHMWFGAGGDMFEVNDHMGDKWIEDLVAWIVGYSLPLETFQGAHILDVGTWTGSTTYALAALGAGRIVSVEEAVKYSMFTGFVSDSYQLPVQAVARSLYELEVESLHEAFDIVYIPGVLYHLSDPLLALRILYNRLKIGGLIIIETEVPVAKVDLSYGPNRGAANKLFACSPHVLQEWLEDAGFTSIVTGTLRRAEAIARKEKPQAMRQAGISRRDIC